MQKKERVLFVGSGEVAARHESRQILEAGGEAIVATSVAAAWRLQGTFDRGVFAFDLPDGSGIVLAAEMMLEKRVRDIRFQDPNQQLLEFSLDETTDDNSSAEDRPTWRPPNKARARFEEFPAAPKSLKSS